MRYCIAFLVLVLFSTQGQAQSYSAWKKTRAELCLGLGVANFLGDLGGANQIGTDYFADLEMNTTRPALTMGLRYKLDPHQALYGGFAWGMVAGDDRLTQWPDRNGRQLQFRSHILELGIRYEFLVVKERVGHIYKLKNIKGQKRLGIYPYGFIGINGFYFDPQGKDASGNWVGLRKYNTEGQGVIPTRRPYSPIGISIPFGFGFRRAIDKRWMWGIEYGLRKTFTDYIDDVSTTYFDNATISSYYGPTAAYVADPNNGANEHYVAGQQRGDPTDNDAYMFFTVTVSYKLKTGRNGVWKF